MLRRRSSDYGSRLVVGLLVLVQVSGFCQDPQETENLRKKLAEYAYSPKLVEDAERHLAGLDSEDYGERRRAMAFLMTATGLQDTLRESLATGTLERRVALKRILQTQADSGAEEKLRLLMRRIQMSGARGLAAGILDALEGRSITNGDTIRVSRAAMAVTLEPDDLPRLQVALTSSTPIVRELALLGIQRLANEEDLAVLLKPLLADADESVQLHVSTLLAAYGVRESLGVLAALLESESFHIRHQSHQLLVVMTEKDFGFYSDGAPGDRQEAASLWKRWVAKFGMKASVKFEEARHWFDEEELFE